MPLSKISKLIKKSGKVIRRKMKKEPMFEVVHSTKSRKGKQVGNVLKRKKVKNTNVRNYNLRVGSISIGAGGASAGLGAYVGSRRRTTKRRTKRRKRR